MGVNRIRGIIVESADGEHTINRWELLGVPGGTCKFHEKPGFIEFDMINVKHRLVFVS